MPRFFFDIDDDHFGIDEEGSILPSVEMARREAFRFAAGVLKDQLTNTLDGTDLRLSVRNEEGTIVLQVAIYLEVSEPDTLFFPLR